MCLKPHLTTEVDLNDKISHIIAYFGLMTMGGMAFERKNYIKIAVILLIYSVLIELIQSQVGRTASFLDVLANLTGILLGLLILLNFDKLLWKICHFLKITR